MDFFDYVGYALFILLCSAILGIGTCVYVEYKWSQAPYIISEAKLIQRSYVPSTRTKYCGVYCTVWDCGAYGICTCDKKEIFRKALPISKLKVKCLYDDIRIYEII
jgi:hypothetical protein